MSSSVGRFAPLTMVVVIRIQLAFFWGRQRWVRWRLARLSTDDRRRTAALSDTSTTALGVLASYPNLCIRLALAGRDGLPSWIAEQLAQDEEPAVRLALRKVNFARYAFSQLLCEADREARGELLECVQLSYANRLAICVLLANYAADTDRPVEAIALSLTDELIAPLLSDDPAEQARLWAVCQERPLWFAYRFAEQGACPVGLAVLLARIADEYLAELLLQNFGKVPAVVQTIAGRYAELLFLPAWSLEGANLRQLFVAAPAATDKQLGPFPAAYVALLAPERLVSGLPAELVPVVTALCESSPLSLAAVRESAALLVQAS